MTPLMLAAFSLTMPLDKPTATENMTEACRLEGDWFLLQTRDAKRVEAGSERIRMSVASDSSVVFTFENVVTNRGTLKVNRSVKPSRLDLSMPDGSTFQGLFELRDETLVICFEAATRGRPNGIDPEGTQWAEQWKRVRR